MIIYVDLLVILNMFIDFILLMGTGTLLKRKNKIFKIICASFIGGISTLLLFFINDNFTLIIYKFLVSIIMVIIAFNYNSFKYFKDNLIWLYIISIILGGSLYLLNDNISFSNKALVFSSNGLKINLFVLILITPFIIYKYIKQNKSITVKYSNYYEISIYYKDDVINEVGFLDTGNNLKDPFFNRPIILINRDLIKRDVNTFLIPYYTVNNHSLLEVFKPNKIIINNHTKRNILIGLSDVNIEGIKIILNKEAI